MIDGTFKIFQLGARRDQTRGAARVGRDPDLFPAVIAVDGHAYWDGIFASNPPVAPLLSKASMGGHELPEEIWVIQINRAHHGAIPETSS